MLSSDLLWGWVPRRTAFDFSGFEARPLWKNQEVRCTSAVSRRLTRSGGDENLGVICILLLVNLELTGDKLNGGDERSEQNGSKNRTLRNTCFEDRHKDHDNRWTPYRILDLHQESRHDIRQWIGNGPACKQHHSKLFLSAETAEIHPTITLHGCRKNTGPFSHIKSCRLLQQHFLRCHKHCCETTSICPQRGCQADLEQEEVWPHHSCVEGPTPLASHSPADRIQDRGLRPQRRPRSRSDLPQLHLQSCPGGRRQGSSAVCYAGRPDCASNQDSSLRA